MVEVTSRDEYTGISDPGEITGSDMEALKRHRAGRTARRRAGAAAVDYVLVLGVIMPLVVFIMAVGPRIARLAYEMVCALIAWPFM